MSITQQILERLAAGPLGQQILAEQAAEVVARRERLARVLADAEAQTLTAREKVAGQRAKLDAKASALRAQLTEVESELLAVGYRLSDADSGFVEQRDKLWKELQAIPDESLTAFREELQSRLDGAASLFRQWPTGEADHRQPDGKAKTDNRADVDTYAHSILRARDQVTAAIRAGFSGDDARKEVARLRAGLSPVRMRFGDTGSIPPG